MTTTPSIKKPFDAELLNDLRKHLDARRLHLVVSDNVEGHSEYEPSVLRDLLDTIAAALNDGEGTLAETEFERLANRLAGAELNYRNEYQRSGAGYIETGRMWDKMRKAGDAIRAHGATIEHIATKEQGVAEGECPKCGGVGTNWNGSTCNKCGGKPASPPAPDVQVAALREALNEEKDEVLLNRLDEFIADAEEQKGKAQDDERSADEIGWQGLADCLRKLKAIRAALTPVPATASRDERDGVTIRDNGANPLIIVSRESVIRWLRSIADKAGYSDRETCGGQLNVLCDFVPGVKYHGEIPELTLMVSNIPNSRAMLATSSAPQSTEGQGELHKLTIVSGTSYGDGDLGIKFKADFDDVPLMRKDYYVRVVPWGDPPAPDQQKPGEK